MTGIDPKVFRGALGQFATGVTVVTTLMDGLPYGMTASSFNSVSLDPPLVLWSLAKSAQSIDTFCQSGHFAVHVLGADQTALSNHFAVSGGDKFSRLIWEKGLLGSPVFEDYAARFECRTLHRYEGGDHIIFVGEVVNVKQSDQRALLFHKGSYAQLMAS